MNQSHTKVNDVKNIKRTVLCYGDSNTWGYIPEGIGRYDTTQRWTCILRSALGNDYIVIEEGLNGRTTVWDDPIELNKNGAAYLPPCLESHKPVDLVVMMLGTNDLKKRFSLSAFDVAAGVNRLVQIIRTSSCGPNGAAPRILLLSPPHIGTCPPMFDQMFEGAEEKSHQLKNHYHQVAEQNSCDFFDVSDIVTASPADGIHLDEQAHRVLGESLAKRVISIFNK